MESLVEMLKAGEPLSINIHNVKVELNGYRDELVRLHKYDVELQPDAISYTAHYQYEDYGINPQTSMVMTLAKSIENAEVLSVEGGDVNKIPTLYSIVFTGLALITDLNKEAIINGGDNKTE